MRRDCKWIARSVKIPVILDGDTGHGGIMAVRRLVCEASMRDLPGCALTISRWSRSGGPCPPDFDRIAWEAVVRYHAAVDAKK